MVVLVVLVVVVLVVVVVVVVVVVGHAPVGCGVQTSTSCPRSVLGLVPFTAWGDLHHLCP